MELVTRPLKSIKPYPGNPRQNDGAVAAVAESIRQCQYIAPIVIDEDGVILAGHTRYKALCSLGYTEAACVVKSGLTGEQKRKYRLLDNKTAEIAEWDMDLLAVELDGLDFDGFDFGFDLVTEGEPEPAREDDYAPEPPTEPRSRPGDVYALGRHRLMCGDSTKVEDVAVLMDGVKADLLLTDPPYNVALGMGGSVDEARNRHRRMDGLVIMNDGMPDDQFKAFLVECFQNARAVMKPGASFYIWHADNKGYTFRGAAEEAGFTIRQTLIWVKNHFTLGRQDYQWKHEPCLYGWTEGAGHAWYGDRKQSTVLNFDKPAASREHPTMKPVALFDDLMRNSSKAGDVVLDLFGGSGTTIIAAEQNGRVGYLMEVDPRYADVIIDRWEKFTGEKAVLLGNSGQ